MCMFAYLCYFLSCFYDLFHSFFCQISHVHYFLVFADSCRCHLLVFCGFSSRWFPFCFVADYPCFLLCDLLFLLRCLHHLLLFFCSCCTVDCFASFATGLHPNHCSLFVFLGHCLFFHCVNVSTMCVFNISISFPTSPSAFNLSFHLLMSFQLFQHWCVVAFRFLITAQRVARFPHCLNRRFHSLISVLLCSHVHNRV